MTDERTFLEQLDMVLSNAEVARTDDQIVTVVTTMVHKRLNELDRDNG